MAPTETRVFWHHEGAPPEREKGNFESLFPRRARLRFGLLKQGGLTICQTAPVGVLIC